MTREEAHVKLLEATRSSCTEGQMVDFIDMAVALGILELDEPKSAEHRAREALTERGFSKRDVNVIEEVLTASKLKIVEK